MRFDGPLIPGRLVRRYKRFLADIELEDGVSVTAHCANPGAMLGLIRTGARVMVSRSNNPKRKLAYSWELVRVGRGWVGINTLSANRLAEEAIAAGRIAELSGYSEIRREVRYGSASRVDFVLGAGERSLCYVEVKNAHLMRHRGLAEFPDSVTARGTRHLKELSALARGSTRATVLMVVQRQDCDRFGVAEDIDPAFGAAWRDAREAGVEMLCYRCTLSPREIVVDKALPILGGKTE